MQRIADNLLKEWRLSTNHKPLLVRGARQVGKTTSIRQFGRTFESFVEINFEELPRLNQLFEEDLDVKRILRDLQLELGVNIILGKTLLFFDEIQMCPQAIISLRYFYEKLPELHVIAAGSLLDFAIEKIGLPVGRISFLYIHPMSFVEFLWALGKHQLADAIIQKKPDEPFNSAIHDTAIKLLGEYLAIGGMPAAVDAWKTTGNYRECIAIHQDILTAYRQDFEKYTKTTQIKYVETVFNEACQQIGKQFIYSHLHNHYKTRELSPALELLQKANIFTPVTHTAAQGIPLAAQQNSQRFKLIMLDVGLMQALLGITAEDWILQTEQTFINKGNIAEAFVGQEMLAYQQLRYPFELHYWERTQRGSVAEIDYLTLNQDREIIPVEVKAGKSGTLKSLHIFLQEHPHSPYGLRYSMSNYSISEKLHSYPLYAVAGLHWQF